MKWITLLTVSLIAGCAHQTSGNVCPSWAADNTYYPSKQVREVMPRDEKEQVAENNRETEKFCGE